MFETVEELFSYMFYSRSILHEKIRSHTEENRYETKKPFQYLDVVKALDSAKCNGTVTKDQYDLAMIAARNVNFNPKGDLERRWEETAKALRPVFIQKGFMNG